FSSVISGACVFSRPGAAALLLLRLSAAGRSIPSRMPGYPWTPFLFVLAAAAIVVNAVYAAFRDPSQFMNLAVAILLFLIGLPAYFFWRKRASGTLPGSSGHDPF